MSKLLTKDSSSKWVPEIRLLIRAPAGLTVWRRRKLRRAAQTAAAPGWRRRARWSLRPEWNLPWLLQLRRQTHKERLSEKRSCVRRIRHRCSYRRSSKQRGALDEQTHSVGMDDAGRADVKRWELVSFFGLDLKQQALLLLFGSQRLTQRTHLPTHGCQSTRGWLQDISLSVSTYEHLHTGGLKGSADDDGGGLSSLLLDPSPHWWQMTIAPCLCFYILLFTLIILLHHLSLLLLPVQVTN